jgi:hypothetical protein
MDCYERDRLDAQLKKARFELEKKKAEFNLECCRIAKDAIISIIGTMPIINKLSVGRLIYLGKNDEIWSSAINKSSLQSYGIQ